MKRILFRAVFIGLLVGCTPTLSETEPRVLNKSVDMQRETDGIICIATGMYPNIENLQSTQVEANINSVLNAYYYRVERDMKNCPELLAELVEEDSEVIDTTDLSYFVKRLDDDYFSVVLVRSQYFEGAAHPNNSLETYTFNLMDGQPIALSEWFTSPEVGEVFLIEKINDQLAADDMDMTYPSDTSNGLGTYYVTDDALVLTDLYSVHAVQGYEVRIPFSEMTDVMRPDAT